MLRPHTIIGPIQYMINRVNNRIEIRGRLRHFEASNAKTDLKNEIRKKNEKETPDSEKKSTVANVAMRWRRKLTWVLKNLITTLHVAAPENNFLGSEPRL